MLIDRNDACIRLSEELAAYCNEDCIIIGIPRGGALIAHCIAEKLKKPWDIIVPRKIGAPFNREVAIGAVAQDGTLFLNEEVIKHYDIPEEYIKNEVKVQTNEIKRRLEQYKGQAAFPDITGKVVILTDDGIATGFTIAAAVNSIKKHNAAKVIIAVPVASIESIDLLKKSVDEIICLKMPKPFISVGSSYMDFEQNTDEEVIALFKQYNSRRLV